MSREELDKEELYNLDFKRFETLIRWKSRQEKYNNKARIKSYNDDKIMKQMFTTILDLLDTIDELNRIIECRNITIRNMKNK
jgi:molecular chaperone GrpE (heat shock protein)